MLFDIGLGILLGLWLGPENSKYANALLGVLFILLPDFDLVLFYLVKKADIFGANKKLRDHREIFHYPLIYITIGGSLIYLINPSLLPVFIAGSLAQFLHDTIGVGWGIPWFYPFYKGYFKLFYQYDLRLAKQPQKILWVWKKKEQDELTDKYGDKEWYRHAFNFLKYAPVWHITEILMFLVGVVVLIEH